MGNYCFVENGEVTYAGHLPKNGKTVSGLNKLSDTELKKYGWLPMVEVNPSYNQATHYRIRPTVDIQEDQVVFTDVIVAFTVLELKQNKWNDWISVMSNHDGLPLGSGITRSEEDAFDMILDANPTAMDDVNYKIIKEKYAAKKSSRENRPEKP
jgi:hypothetical protein